jgi:hypothetical protein
LFNRAHLFGIWFVHLDFFIGRCNRDVLVDPQDFIVLIL